MAKTLYVGNLPWAVTKEDLAAFFANYVPVKSSRVITDPANGRSKGFGFIEIDEENVETIINDLNGKSLGGREIIVNEAKQKELRV